MTKVLNDPKKTKNRKKTNAAKINCFTEFKQGEENTSTTSNYIKHRSAAISLCEEFSNYKTNFTMQELKNTKMMLKN